MAALTASPRSRSQLLAATFVALVVLVAGCSSSDDDAAPSGTTTSPDTSIAETTTTAPDGSIPPTTAGPTPSAPSSLPPSVDGTCAALDETLGLDEIQPRNTSSWVDERQRIVIDAQREAALLATAQQGAPTEITSGLATMQAYATWLSTTIQGAADFSAAVTAVGSYPDLVAVSLATARVQTWQNTNCPD